MANQSASKKETSRIGFHYFQDTTHYTNRDLSTWLPELTRLSAKWLILRSDSNRAIPEQFLSGVLAAGISPIVHLTLPLPNTPSSSDLKSILEAYSRWGIKHIILFDKPNTLQSWSASGWSQQDLVERFIDRFLPLALTVSQLGMVPVFPPLQPGGNYWDLSFLKQALSSLKRRGYANLVKQMAFSAYAYTFNHELDWGEGAQKKWPKVRPYEKVEDSQDQCGFNNYEWVQAIIKSCCETERPIFLLGAGIKDQSRAYSPEVHAEIVQNILERLNGIPQEKAIPSYVQACNFFVLSAEANDEEYPFAWFKSRDNVLPIVNMLTPGVEKEKPYLPVQESFSKDAEPINDISETHPIAHYLLLPLYEWGVAEYHLEITRAFIQRIHPTVGFSPQEAMLARRVTVIGGEQSFSEDLLNQMRAQGIVVERINGDGTSIATQLAER